MYWSISVFFSIFLFSPNNTQIFSVIYVVGLLLVTMGSLPTALHAWFFLIAIYIVALGTGGIKPNVSTMGADQFDEKYAQDRVEKESFFNWFYWAINLGKLTLIIVLIVNIKT